MKTIGITLLIFEMTAHFIARLGPIPFFSFFIILLGFPLALKLSIKELFTIQIVSSIFGLIIQANMWIQYYGFATSIVGSPLTFWRLVYNVYFFVGVTIGLFFTSLFLTLLMKLLSRFTPKRIKVVLNEK